MRLLRRRRQSAPKVSIEFAADFPQADKGADEEFIDPASAREWLLEGLYKSAAPNLEEYRISPLFIVKDTGEDVLDSARTPLGTQRVDGVLLGQGCDLQPERKILKLNRLVTDLEQTVAKLKTVVPYLSETTLITESLPQE